MELLEQKVDVIECLADEVNTVSELKEMISSIFSDDVKGIMLSTIHKAKGLENDRVFFLLPELIPSKYATQDWQYEQEQNLFFLQNDIVLTLDFYLTMINDLNNLKFLIS